LDGTPVIAEFICSDVCPDYTVRVIRYELKKDQTCSRVGGVEKALRIPVGIAATDKKFCFPKVLVNNWDKYQKKLSYVPSGVGPHE
jgi:5,10-methylene-tetrahydrofolate dehydrogenase/methenyl tetrahydrofolate cyclohydrolase